MAVILYKPQYIYPQVPSRCVNTGAVCDHPRYSTHYTINLLDVSRFQCVFADQTSLYDIAPPPPPKKKKKKKKKVVAMWYHQPICCVVDSILPLHDNMSWLLKSGVFNTFSWWQQQINSCVKVLSISDLFCCDISMQVVWYWKFRLAKYS